MNARCSPPEVITATIDTQQLPMRDVLSRAGHESIHLAWQLDQLLRHILPVLQDVAAREPNMLHQIQSFDHICQFAHCLGDFLKALASEAPHSWAINPTAAAKAVTLADLSSRLGFADEEQGSCLTAWGDCELF